MRDVHMDWPHARHGGANGDAGHGVFRQRGREYPVWPEAFDEAAGRPLDRDVVIDVEAEDEHRRIALHFLRDSFAQRLRIGQQAMRFSRQRHRCGVPLAGGNGLFSAKARASSIRHSISASIAARRFSDSCPPSTETGSFLDPGRDCVA